MSAISNVRLSSSSTNPIKDKITEITETDKKISAKLVELLSKISETDSGPVPGMNRDLYNASFKAIMRVIRDYTSKQQEKSEVVKKEILSLAVTIRKNLSFNKGVSDRRFYHKRRPFRGHEYANLGDHLKQFQSFINNSTASASKDSKDAKVQESTDKKD